MQILSGPSDLGGTIRWNTLNRNDLIRGMEQRAALELDEIATGQRIDGDGPLPSVPEARTLRRRRPGLRGLRSVR